MKTGSFITDTQSKNIMRIVVVTGVILLVPLLAMQFTNEVAWSAADFIVAGVLLLGTGLTYELIVKKVLDIKHRVVFTVVLLAAFLLIWVELAVGIFGTPFSGS